MSRYIMLRVCEMHGVIIHSAQQPLCDSISLSVHKYILRRRSIHYLHQASSDPKIKDYSMRPKLSMLCRLIFVFFDISM